MEHGGNMHCRERLHIYKMEEESSDTNLNALCYVSDHVGFYGTIKNSPADFIVTEMDDTGQLVTMSHIKELKDEHKESDSEPQFKKQKRDPGASGGHSTPEQSIFLKDRFKPITENMDSGALVCEAALYNSMNPLLSEDVQEAINHFASSVKYAFESQAKVHEPCELLLGSFPSKDDRAAIHSAVRQAFPFLLTFTKNSNLLVKPNLDYQELSQLTSEEEADKFFTFLDAKVEASRFTFHPDVCKEHRTSVHHFISKKFGKLLETKTFSENGIDGVQRVSITVRFREKKSSSGKRQRAQEHSEVFTAFSLEKQNLETLEAISYLSSVLGVLPSDFSYAGNKDKKAITYQSMVVKKVTPERVSLMTWSSLHLSQRDERRGPKALAVKYFFTPENCDDPVNKAKRYFSETEDAKGALALMPDCKVRERLMLRALNRYGMNEEGCIRAWLSIPHSMRILYIHTYCSKVWNEAASSRIATYGLKVVEGDLVFHRDNNGTSSLQDRVHLVTDREEAENVYFIHEVVLPMPGHSVKYPSNQVGQWYKEALSKSGLQSSKFRVGSLQLNIPGCYRHILKYPHNVLHELFIEEDDQNIVNEERTKSEVLQPPKPSLKLTFDLDSSCYATVCLREIMKCNL
ncbi:pseudouridylate synthase PUS7L [Hyperolius riggenbachi]|uniref:pseudouridylate synthase PUS7L n=1 Tax=Hyperolius riggenbachi TaxID=752182 RepID=UPI0035A33A6D